VAWPTADGFHGVAWITHWQLLTSIASVAY
jgi:hypothetical protein